MNALEGRLKDANLKWLSAHEAMYTHAVTLTLKPYRVVKNDRGVVREPCDQRKAQANLRIFLNRIDARNFGHAAKRYGRRVIVLPFFHGVACDKLLHYHLAMGGFRDELSDSQIETMISEEWARTPFGNQQTDVKRKYSAGWISYSADEVGCLSADALDL